VIFSPLPLIALPLAAAVLTVLLRRFPTASALLAALFPAAAALVAIVYPLDNPLPFLGRDLYLTTPDRYALIYLYLCAAATFLGVWRTTTQWTYYPVALAALACIAAALGARPVIVEVIGGRPFDPFNYAVLLFAIGAVLTIFPLQGGRPGVTIGTLRYVTFMVIGVPMFLAAAWILDQYSQSPDAVNLAQAATALLLFGLALWLATLPFHSWLPSVASEAPPLSSAFVLGIVNVAAFFLMLDLVSGIRLLADNPVVFDVVRVAGLATALAGGALAFAQRDFGRILGYAVLADIGVALVAFGTHTTAGLSAALFVVFLRTFGLGLMSMGLALARTEAPDDTFVSMTSLAWRRPWAAVGLIVGAFSLAGVPPLAGFAGRWGALQQAAGNDLGASLALVVSSIGVVAGTLRGLQYVLRPIDDPAVQPVRESTLTIALIVGALMLCLIFGLFPDLLSPIIRQMAASYVIAP
jgi:formate hydrogenlyase subunit 3/multisubunit Na+/H+ antiporter MnhD subunit